VFVAVVERLKKDFVMENKASRVKTRASSGLYCKCNLYIIAPFLAAFAAKLNNNRRAVVMAIVLL